MKGGGRPCGRPPLFLFRMSCGGGHYGECGEYLLALALPPKHLPRVMITLRRSPCWARARAARRPAVLGPALRLVATMLVAAAELGAQQATIAPPPSRPPFPIGEALEYRVHVAVGGNVGKGQMRVEGPVAEQGVSTWKLVFELDAGRGPVRASDRTASWLDPIRFATVRFEKTERHPLSRSEERILIDQEAGTWRDGDGPPQPLGSQLPLDELSFIYFLRTLPMDRDSTYSFDRHFDATRNPTIVRVGGEEVIETPVGIFRTRLVEMQVRDPKRFRGTGTIRVNIAIGDCHVPVRIRSSMPLLGATTLSLIGWVSPPRYPGALPCDG